MGRGAGLTTDPIRLSGSDACGLALQRLDRSASAVAPLRTAERGLATLTCRRLESLLSPRRGDDVLAAALARYDATAGAEHASLERAALVARVGAAAGRTSAPLHRAPAVRRHPPPARRSTESDVGLAATDDVRGRRRERLDVSGTGGAERLADWDAGAPDPAAVRGLEWLTHAAPGAAEAAAAPLDVVRTLRSPVEARSDATSGEHRGARSPDDVASLGTVAPVVPFDAAPRDVVRPAREQSAEHRAPDLTGQLAALIRAWDEAPSSDERRRDVAPPALPSYQEAPPSDVLGEAQPAAPVEARPLSAVTVAAPSGEQELLGFGDQLGRVLVSELRRHGIEVET